MNSRTKQIFVLAFLLFFVAVGACAFLLFQIKTTGSQLEQYIAAENERNSQENNYIAVNRRILNTETERAELSRAFFTDEGDSIGFIGEIETFASEVGIALVTEGLDKQTAKDGETEYITVTFVYTGNKEQVLTFTQYLEEVPYHSHVETLSLSRQNPSTWEGKLTLHITLLPS